MRKLTIGLIAVFAVFMSINTASAATVVTSASMQDWTTYNYGTNGQATFLIDQDAPAGAGAAELNTPGGSDVAGLDLLVDPIALGDIQSMGYSVKRLGGAVHASPAYVIGFATTGSGEANVWAWFEPVYNGGTDYDAWQNYTFDKGSTLFWSSSVVGSKGGANGANMFTLDDVQTAYPDAKVVEIAINQGSGNDGWDTLVDNIDFNGVTYDFDLDTSTLISNSEGEYYNNLQDAVNNTSAGGTITLNADTTVSSLVLVNKAIIIDGGNHTLYAPIDNSANSNSNNAGIGIVGANGNVTINNLIVDGSGGVKIHGINIFESTDVVLNHVTVKNNSKSGITVNGSTVTVNNVTTDNNAWGGINADKAADAPSPTRLTISGRSSHSEATQIWVDDITKDVQVNDTLNQYSYEDTGNTRVYTLVTGNPVITLNGDASMTVAFGSNFEDPGATAVDSRGNTVDVAITGSVDTRNPGDYTLTYSATDSLDNSAQLTRTVTVSAPPARSSSGRRGGGGGGTAVSLPAQASPVAVAATGEVLGAFTDAETQAQIVIVKQQIAGLIQQLIAMLQAQLAAAIAAQ